MLIISLYRNFLIFIASLLLLLFQEQKFFFGNPVSYEVIHDIELVSQF